MNEETLFIEALGIRDAVARAAFLDRACAGDAAVRDRLQRLLDRHERAGNFLARPAWAPPGTGHHAPGADATGTFPSPAPGEGGRTVRAPGLARPPCHPAPEEEVGTMIGPYKLLQQIGEGGMGTVFMAGQTFPVQRKVAVKLIKAGMDSRQVLARFEAERQALALMDHPNIARVFDAGTTDGGKPYFVMELVKGVPITRYCDAHQLTCNERLELFVGVCRAIQHAHQKGVIHRDLKPSNVLVCHYDGRPVPKVIDFGVAKAAGQKLTDRTLFTEVGSVVGTLEYMSPEQAEVNQLDIDTRSDIYSLGVLMYELLTGTTPLERKRCRSSSFFEVLRLIREEDPPRPSTRLGTAEELRSIAANRGLEPRRLSGLVRGELDWIAMKALDKDRSRRYETASGLAADVRRFLNDEPVQACPPSARYRFRKFARRNKGALAAAAAAVGVVAAAVVGLATSNLLISRALTAETQARYELKQTNERERVEGYFRRIALAHAALSGNDLGAARTFLKNCPEDLRGWEWRYLMRLCRVDPVVVRTGDGKAVHGVAFSPNGGRLVSADGDGAVRVRDSKTGKLIRAIPNAHPRFACCVAFHPHGNHVASVGADGRVKVWDLTADPPRKVFERPCDAVHPFGTAYSAAFSPLDPDCLAVGCDGTVTIWNWKTEEPVHTFPGHETDRISVAFSPDGRRLAAGNWHGTVRLWDAVAGAGRGSLHTFTQTGGVRHPVAALAFSRDGTRLAAAGFARRVDVWDTTTGRLLHTLPHPGELVLGVAFGRDGLLASVGENKIVRVWDAAGRELLGLRGHAGWCGCAAFSPDGLRLASAGSDGTVRLWDATPLRGGERQEWAFFEEHGDEVWSVAVNPAGPGVVSAGWSMPALVWDAGTGRVRARFGGHGVVAFCVAWHPDGRRVASVGSADGRFSVKVWDAATGADVFTLPAPGRSEFFAAAFSPDGHHLVTGRGNGDVQVWAAGDGREIGTLGTHAGPVRGVVFSPDRRHLATASADGAVKLWDATRLGEKREPQQPLRTFLGHSPGPVVSVAFSPDGKRLVMADKGYAVKVCDVATGEELLVLRGHTGDVHAVAFSPGGRWIASAGEDSTVRIWDGRTGQPVRTFRGHTGLVTSLAFLDKRTLLSGSRDHTIKFWNLAPLDEVTPR